MRPGHTISRRKVALAATSVAGLLLKDFVGDLVAREFVAHAEADAIAVGEVAFVADGEVAGSAFVGVVLGHDGVEIVAGHIATGGGRGRFPRARAWG